MATTLQSFSAYRMLLVSILLCLYGAGQAQSGPEIQAHHTAIEAFYPVMLGHVSAGRLDDARALCQKAIEWEPQSPVHRYNLACIESKASNPERALDALNQATARGFNDANSLRTDPDLAAVRADARFAAVVQRASHNAGTAPAASPAPATGRPVYPARPAAPVAPAPTQPAASAAAGPAVLPAAAVWTNGRLTGLFYMSRYWVSSGYLEKAVWYFAPDGRVYFNPGGGFSAADLAAHKGSRGTYQLAGGKLTVTWSDGKKSAADFEVANGGFNWDTGMFMPVRPFANARSLVGNFEGGTSLSSGAGAIAVSSALSLRADGSYSLGGTSSVRSTTAESTASGGSQSQNSGRWSLSGYTLTLTSAQGTVTRGIVFPFDDKTTAVYPDQMYFAGTMYKKY